MTKAVIVRYRTSEEAAQENQRLVEQVYAELNADQPEGLRYMTLRLADGVTFVHVAFHADDDNPLTRSAAFGAFQADLPSRVVDPPQPSAATVVGSYGF
jgi:hypothetical protein